ncbi:MAG: hypothetical protein PHR68_01070 [Candidatus Gracilibacteria bacterium]|nr:hypothetical protein [Candidatus Gracilibacteria bacterium]
MKTFIKIFFLLSFSLSTLVAQASWISDIFSDSNPETPYCQDDECSLESGITVMKAGINDIEKDRKASTYVQDIIKYVLGFVTLVGVIYIIYSGFQIMISAGAEDKVKKSKMTIFYIFMGIVLIWLAYPIVNFMMKLLNTPTTN